MKPVKNTIDIEREERDKMLLNLNSNIRLSIGPWEDGQYWRNIRNTDTFPYQTASANAYGSTTTGGRAW